MKGSYALLSIPLLSAVAGNLAAAAVAPGVERGPTPQLCAAAAAADSFASAVAALLGTGVHAYVGVLELERGAASIAVGRKLPPDAIDEAKRIVREAAEKAIEADRMER